MVYKEKLKLNLKRLDSLTDMEQTENVLESLLEKVSDYGHTSLELAKLKTLDTTASVVSSLAFYVIVLVILLVFMITLNIGLSLWIGELLGKFYMGFFIVTLFDGISGFVLYYFLETPIRKGINNIFIHKALEP
jgi:hypothetical protein